MSPGPSELVVCGDDAMGMPGLPDVFDRIISIYTFKRSVIEYIGLSHADGLDIK